MGQGPLGPSAGAVTQADAAEARPPGFVDRALGLLAAAAMALLAVTVLLGVFSRALGDPLIFTDEVSRFLMVWTACLGWMIATRRRSHIRIRYFYDKLPPLPRGLLEAAIQLLIALFGILLIWHGASLVARNIEIEATTVPLPMSVVYAPIVLAGLCALAEAFAELAALRRRGAP